jgi:hypothetical protein
MIRRKGDRPMRALRLAIFSVLTLMLGVVGATAQVFSPYGTVSRSVSSSSANVALTLDPQGRSPQTAMVCNTGATLSYVKFGSSTVAATTGDTPIVAGACVALTPAGGLYIAAITASSTSTLLITSGAGLPTGYGGGSSGGGGGGGAVTIADGADVTQGAIADPACAGDATSGCTVESRLIRIAQNLTTVNGSVNSSIPPGTNPIGAVSPLAAATGGATQYHLVAANSNNATALKASAGTVYSVQLASIGAAPAYLKFYNKATTPTCQTDPVVKQLIIPAASTAANGGGSNVSIPVGSDFSAGIAFCVVTGIADNDNTSVAAATFIINIDYK